ncbi:MAG: hypothetical protein U5K79_23995 [Cyclobacteriaceae bacterium]|nr:hypothetical protein [Cyclobacteriaceae bacterium]
MTYTHDKDSYNKIDLRFNYRGTKTVENPGKFSSEYKPVKFFKLGGGR